MVYLPITSATLTENDYQLKCKYTPPPHYSSQSKPTNNYQLLYFTTYKTLKASDTNGLQRTALNINLMKFIYQLLPFIRAEKHLYK